MSEAADNSARSNPQPFRLQESDAIGFEGDTGARVPIVWHGKSESPEESILNDLEDIGAHFPDRDQAAEVIARGFDVHGDQRAAEALALFFSRLPGGRRGEELRAAFLGSIDGESLDETAKRHDVCKVTWFKSITRLRARLFQKTANEKP